MRLPYHLNIFLILFIITFSQSAFSQPAQINGIIKNAPNGKLFLLRPAYQFNVNNVNLGRKEVLLDGKGKFKLAVDLVEPEIMKGLFVDSAGNSLVNYNFYLSPGDNLKMEKDEKLIQNNFKVTGKGSKNNQLLAIDGNDSIVKFYGDTLPERVIGYLELQNTMHKKTLEAYVQKYRPSPNFIAALNANLQYEMLKDYFSFSTNNAYQIGDAYKRTHDQWDAIKESLFVKAPFVNEPALISAAYKQFLYTYLGRTKEGLWNEYRNRRSDFLLEWYGKDTAAGARLYEADNSNDLQQRIIEKYFTGRVKEYLYAALMNMALVERDFKNISTLYDQFKSQFPLSSYHQLFDGAMKEIASKKDRKLTAEMIFIDAEQFKRWEDIQAYFKGKTVLLDMWGTWCGPCRQDMDRHGEFIKTHFKDKPLDFFYIANGDIGREKLWKELIAYFNLAGYHINAPKALTKDIMTKVKGQGYPTYVILHKDGTFENYERGYGIDREKLIAQLENALKSN